MAKSISSAKTNIFAAAKKAAPASTTDTKKSTMPVVTISEKEVKGFGADMKAWAKYKADAAKLKVDLDLVAGKIRTAATNAWVTMFKNTGMRTTSIKVTDDKNESEITFTSADAYQAVKADKAAELRATYGDDVVTEKEVYSFDAKMLEKYGALISEFITTSKKIADEDRLNIIKCDTTYAVTPGTVDNLLQLSKDSKVDFEKVIADFGPTFQMK